MPTNTDPDTTLVLDLTKFRSADLAALVTALNAVYTEAENAGSYEASDHLHEVLQALEVHPRFWGDSPRRR